MRELIDSGLIDSGLVDSGLVGSTDWEGCRDSRRCSRDTYPESYITKYTSIKGGWRSDVEPPSVSQEMRKREVVGTIAGADTAAAVYPTRLPDDADVQVKIFFFITLKHRVR